MNKPYYFTFVEDFFIMGQYDNELPEDELKIQFVFRDKIFRELDEVYMDQFLTENLQIKDFRVLPSVKFTKKLLSELKTRKIAKEIKKVSNDHLLIFRKNSFCKLDPHVKKIKK
jgi:hypothetical protein